MKTTGYLKSNVLGSFKFDTLNEKEMSVVVGGKRPRPKTRDKDKFDFEDEQ